jgi:Protein of unknown function (DUF2442)
MKPTSTNAGSPSAARATAELGVAVAVRCDDRRLHVTLSNGRVVSAPLADFPRLMGATRGQRATAIIEAFGTSIHWPDVDEDIGVSQLLGVSEETLDRFAGFTIHASRPG